MRRQSFRSPRTSPVGTTTWSIQAELVDRGPAKGTMVIRPYGYRIWELLQADLDAPHQGDRARERVLPAVHPGVLPQARGRARRGLLARAGGRHPRRRQGARGAARRAADLRDGHRRDDGQVDLELAPRPAAAAQPVGERRALGAAAAACSCARPSSSGRRATPRTPTRTTRCARRCCALDVYADVARDVAAIPVVPGREDAGRALRRRGAHLLHRGHDARRQGAAGGTSHYLGTNFAKAFDIQYTDDDRRSAAVPHHVAGA